MDILKKHYEKLILSLVLIGLAAAAALLVLKVSDLKRSMVLPNNFSAEKEYEPIDISTNRLVMSRLSDFKLKQDRFEISKRHNVFNPVKWVKSPAGQLNKIENSDSEGVGSLMVESISPLFLKIEFQTVVEGYQGKIRYRFAITREAESQKSKQSRKQESLEVGEKNDVFILRDVTGSASNPSEISLELIENKERIAVSPTQSFEMVAGYKATLRSQIDSKVFNDRRVDDEIQLSGEKYKIVSITDNEVVLSSETTQKRSTVKRNASE